MSALIIVSCSERKVRNPVSPIPAIERYDGVFYQVLRKARRDGRLGRWVKVVILSAEYGLIHTSTRIPYYNRRLDGARADTLRKQVQMRLRRVIRVAQADRIYVNAGRDYLALIDDIAEVQAATCASGGIGTRAQTLKRWIDLEHSSVSENE